MHWLSQFEDGGVKSVFVRHISYIYPMVLFILFILGHRCQEYSLVKPARLRLNNRLLINQDMQITYLWRSPVSV